MWLFLWVERMNIYLHKSREWLTVIDQSDICAVLGSVLCAVVKKDIKLLNLYLLKTETFLSEWVLMKAKGFLYRKNNCLIRRYSPSICLSHRFYFLFPWNCPKECWCFVCLFVFPLSFCFWQKILKKWVIISYQFVENIIFVLKPNSTFFILFFQKDSISNILELN